MCSTGKTNLKEKGFFQANGKKINVDWDRFANEVIGNSFLEDLGDKAQYAEFILSEPPKRQVANEDNQIIWQDVANNDKSVQSLFGHITRVRNNLYHGAKFNGTWFDPQRSKDLIEASVIILRHYEDCIRN